MFGIRKKIYAPFNSNLSKRYFSSEELEEYEDDEMSIEESDAPKASSQMYQFYQKSIAIQLASPLFPFASKDIYLEKLHAKL